MSSKTKKLLSHSHWMIHELSDAEKISNEEEMELVKLRDLAELELNKIFAWLIKAHNWFEKNDNISVNSTGYKELDEIVKEIK